MIRKVRKVIATFLLFSLIFCMALSGCGKKDVSGAENSGENEAQGDENVSESTEGTQDNPTSLTVDEDGFVVTNDYVKTTGANVNVRVKPNTDCDIYMVLDKGVDLNRTGYNGEWTRVKLNGSNFYVYSEYVEETEIEWATEGDAEKVSHVIFLDPAKQMRADTETEPIGPGAEEEKAKASTGATGVSTGNPEYEITLAVAEYLKEELNSRGYTVYIARETNEVNISNAERAEMANAREVEVYVKLQAGSSQDSAASGVMGFINTSSGSYGNGNYQQSYDLCRNILFATSIDTGAKRLGIYETDNLTTLNWCKMPATVINIGFLSNEADDTALASSDYQKKLANAIADGIDLYFEGESEE